jgi:exosome complex component RRP41
MDGILTVEETEEAINMAIEGCKKIYELQREALKKKYGMAEGESVPEEEESEAEEEPSEEPEEPETDEE